MKKIKLFLTVLFLSICTLSNAQYEGDWLITPNMSGGYTSLTRHNGYRNAWNMSFGMGATYMLSDDVGLSSGVWFKYMQTEIRYDCRYKYSYISIPIIFSYNVFPDVTVFAGVSANIMADAKISDIYGSIPMRNEMNPMYVSIPFGININICGPLYMGVTYDPAITNLRNDNRVMTNNVMLTIGYSFDILM